MKHLLIALAVLSLTACSASAQGTDAEKKACHRDAVRFCDHALSGGPFTVGACLAANKSRLSAACRVVLSQHGM